MGGGVGSSRRHRPASVGGLWFGAGEFDEAEVVGGDGEGDGAAADGDGAGDAGDVVAGSVGLGGREVAVGVAYGEVGEGGAGKAELGGVDGQAYGAGAFRGVDDHYDSAAGGEVRAGEGVGVRGADGAIGVPVGEEGGGVVVPVEGVQQGCGRPADGWGDVAEQRRGVVGALLAVDPVGVLLAELIRARELSAHEHRGRAPLGAVDQAEIKGGILT